MNTKPPPGAPIIEQSPRHTVGSTVYVTVPGPVPVIKAKPRIAEVPDQEPGSTS